MRRTLSQAARYYAGLGLRVFPCRPRGKQPLTPGGFKSATVEPGRIDQWWKKHPDANIGIATGAGLVVVDVDGPEGEVELGRLGGLAEPTLVSKTAKGQHFYFTTPVPIASRVRVLPGIDVRGDGGYVIAPPSVHETGTRYQWLTTGMVSPSPIPTALLAALQNGSTPHITLLPDVIHQGERNATLTSLAGTMRRRGASEEGILAALTAENAARCQPPLPPVEVRAIAHSVARYEPEATYDQGAKSAGSVVRNATSVANVASVACRGGTWPEPLAQVALVGFVGKVVEEVAPHSEADPAALVIQLLVGFGSALGHGPHFRVEADRHGVNEFALLVGATAKGRKGTSWGYTRAILSRADPSWIWRSGLSSGEGMIWHVRDAITKPGKHGPVVVDNGVADKRLLLVESEFASAVHVMARDGNTLSPTLRMAWDGAPILETLTKNSPARASDPHIALIGHITADELMTLDRTELVNGFLNRFLLVCVKRSKVLPEGGSLSEEMLDLLGKRAGTLLRRSRKVGLMVRTDEARARWREAYPELSTGRPGMFGAVISRAEAHVMRLACLYALLDEQAVVDREHLDAALAVWRYCEASAEFLFGCRLGDPDAERLLAELRKAGQLDRTQVRDVFQRHKTAQEVDRILGLLQASGLATKATEATEGRPREVWRLLK